VIIPAAGIGSRMAANTAKQYLNVADKTIIEHTIEAFLLHANISQIVVVLHHTDTTFTKLKIASDPKINVIMGGNERVDSVLAGLQFLFNNKKEDSFVLVHDAARPCIDANDITRLINSCMNITPQDDVCGAILACKVVDTIKQANVVRSSSSNGHIKTQLATIDTTIDRTLLWQAQTPQMFKINELIAAIENASRVNAANHTNANLDSSSVNDVNNISLKKIILTDEASAMEYAGKRVMLVEGPSSNLKITHPSDLALASFYLGINK
jgi:2-C-methyl-D-erythritol 4-phosphate cytidylyltransferase